MTWFEGWESYSDGDMNTVASPPWTASASGCYYVQSTVKNSGSKALLLDGLADSRSANRAISPAILDGSVVAYFRIDSTSGVVQLQIRTNSNTTSAAAIKFNSDGTVDYHDNLDWQQLSASYSADQWYKLEIQWRQSDGYTREIFNDTDDSGWHQPWNTWTTNDIDAIRLNTASGMAGIDFFVDDITLTDDNATTTTSTSSTSSTSSTASSTSSTASSTSTLSSTSSSSSTASSTSTISSSSTASSTSSTASSTSTISTTTASTTASSTSSTASSTSTVSTTTTTATSPPPDNLFQDWLEEWKDETDFLWDKSGVTDPFMNYIELYDLNHIFADFIELYDLVGPIEKEFIELYDLGVDVERDFIELYEILDYNPVQNEFEELYSIIQSGTVQQTNIIRASTGSTVLNMIDFQISCDEDSYCFSLTMTLGDVTSWNLCTKGTQVLIDINGKKFYFIIDTRTRSRIHGVTDYNVEGRSRTSLLSFPNADPYTKEWSATTAETVVQELCDLYSIPLDFQITDWPIPAGVLVADEESPLSIIRKIIEGSGAILQSSLTGALVIIYKYPDSPTTYEALSSDIELSDLDDIEVVNEFFEEKKGYNKVFVSNKELIDDSEGYLSIELDHVLNFGKSVFTEGDEVYVRIYASDEYDVEITGGSIVKVSSDVSRNADAETLNFIGEEYPDVSYPVNSLTGVTWYGTDLGNISLVGSHNISASGSSTDTIGIGKVEYTTIYDVWKITLPTITDIFKILVRSTA